MSVEKRKKQKLKPRAIILAVVVLGLVITGIVYWSIKSSEVGSKENDSTSSEEEPEGYINCMPPLDDDQAKLCEEAKKKGWKIAY